jgi:hypothetical protein
MTQTPAPGFFHQFPHSTNRARQSLPNTNIEELEGQNRGCWHKDVARKLRLCGDGRLARRNRLNSLATSACFHGRIGGRECLRKPDDGRRTPHVLGIKAKPAKSRPTAVFFLILSNVHENQPLIAASAVAGRVLYSELERDSHLPEIDASAIFRSRFAQHLAFLNLPRNDSEIAFGAPEYCLAISIKVSDRVRQ